MEEKNKKNGEETITLIDLLIPIVKRWKLILSATIIAYVLITLYANYTARSPYDAPYNFWPNLYIPTVEVRLQDEQSASSSALGTGSSNLSALAGLAGVKSGGASSVALSRSLLLGNTIVDQIAETFYKEELEEKSLNSVRGKIKKSIKSQFNNSSGILTISYEDYEPERPTEIVNYAVTLLEKRFRNLTMARILNKKNFLEERIAEVETSLEEMETKFINFQINNGIVNAVEDEDTGNIELVFNKYMQPLERHRIALEYRDKLRDTKILESIYKLLMNQYETTKIEEMDDTNTFQILETAEVPNGPSHPNRRQTKILITVIVFFLTLILSFIFEYFSNAKRDPLESEKLKKMKDAFWNRK